MARAPSAFQQQDVTRAVKAVTAAGVHIARIEIDKSGKIVIITADPTGRPGQMTEANEWLKLPPYVQAFVDRHGRARFYFRRRGYQSVPLPGLPWSPTFMTAYEEAKGEPCRIEI